MYTNGPIPFTHTAVYQVMCDFKALKADNRQREDTVTLEEFYTFYDIQNLKWTKVEEVEENVEEYEKVKRKQ